MDNLPLSIPAIAIVLAVAYLAIIVTAARACGFNNLDDDEADPGPAPEATPPQPDPAEHPPLQRAARCQVASLVPDDAYLFDIARDATAKGLHLISNGTRFALSPTVPPHWHCVPVGDKHGRLGA